MSLIDYYMEDCKVLNKITSSDGEGGTVTTWQEGAKIKAAIVLDNSTLGKIAAAQGVQSLYTITTSKDVELAFPDVIKRISDGTTYQVTSGSEKAAPNYGTLNIRQVAARKWELAT